MNLAVDIGNTFIKAGLFENNVAAKLFWNLRPEDLRSLVEEQKPEKIIVCSVAKDQKEIQNLLPASSLLWLDHTTPLPFQNHYKTPETLGMDRLAAAAGARFLFLDSDRLVIDAGTCITYEFMDKKDSYQGGMIAPGIEMRFKSLNTFTSRLPLVSGSGDSVDLIGKNTEESIRAGVLKGIIAETEGIMKEFQEKYPGIKIILCGGDAPFFETNIKETIFAVPELVLIGLNSILLHNASIR